jgi:alpha 1,2-mannosyltransferase
LPKNDQVYLKKYVQVAGTQPKIKGCIMVLLRNKNLIQFAKTMKQFEYVFNHNYNYPYILLNDEEFSSEFKETIVKYTSSKVEFGLIPREEWSVPEWIDKSKLQISLENMPFSVSYRHMCRYFSGFFFRHNLTLKYDYFWRIDYDSYFPCPFYMDPFRVLVSSQKLYGFVLLDGEVMQLISKYFFTVLLLTDRKKKTTLFPVPY